MMQPTPRTWTADTAALQPSRHARGLRALLTMHSGKPRVACDELYAMLHFAALVRCFSAPSAHNLLSF